MTFATNIAELKDTLKGLQQQQTNLESAVSALYADVSVKVAQRVQAASPDEPVPNYALLETDATLSNDVRTIISDTYSLGNSLHPLHSSLTERAKKGTGNPLIDSDLMSLYTPRETLAEMLGLAKSPTIGMALGAIQAKALKALTERNQASLQTKLQIGIGELDLEGRKNDAIAFFKGEYDLDQTRFSVNALASKLPQMAGIYVTGTPTTKEQIYALLK